MRSDPNRRRFIRQAAAGGLALAAGGRFGRIRAEAAPLKVGVVYVSPVADVGWTKQHDLARRAAEAEFGQAIQVTAIESVGSAQDSERVFRDLVRQGHKLIFGTSFSHGTPMQKAAAQAPDTYFEHCSGLKTLANLGVFEARYYEGTYLAGIIAGKMTKTGVLGFVGGFPIPDVIGALNALTLGARSVNPEAGTKVIWLNSWFDPGREREAATTLHAQGADVILSMTDTPAAVQAADEKGVYSIGYASDYSKYAPKGHLTSFTLDWSSIYIHAVKEALAGTWRPLVQWEGLKTGVVKLSPLNPAIPQDVVALIKGKEAAIVAGTLHPYQGPVKDQTGALKVAAGAILADEDLKKINWAVEGVQGSLPKQ